MINMTHDSLPMIAAMKCALACASDQPDWKRLRPPLVPLTITQQNPAS